MSKERFIPIVVPNKAGDPSWILQRAPLGEAKRERWRVEHNKKAEKFLDGFRKDEPDDWEPNADLIKFADIRAPFSDYKIDLSEVITPDEKRKIFIPSIRAMRKIIAQYGVEAPEEEDLLSRLLIVDGETFRNVSFQEGNQEDYTASDQIAGELFLHLKLSLLNHSVHKRNSSLRGSAVHELWHSVAYTEYWVAEEYKDRLAELEVFPERRVGIISNRRKRGIVGFGLHSLDEGLMDYLTLATLDLAGEEPHKPGYRRELTLLNLLVERIGLETLIAAHLTKKGFRDLFKALDSKYGRHAMSKLGFDLAIDYRARDLAELLHTPGERLPNYNRTRRFIKRIPPISS